MDNIYYKILELATPYYKKGRIYDLEQINWMLKQAELLVDKLNLDKTILIPLIILHDVGYAFVNNCNPNIKSQVVQVQEHPCSSPGTSLTLFKYNDKLLY